MGRRQGKAAGVAKEERRRRRLRRKEKATTTEELQAPLAAAQLAQRPQNPGLLPSQPRNDSSFLPRSELASPPGCAPKPSVRPPRPPMFNPPDRPCSPGSAPPWPPFHARPRLLPPHPSPPFRPPRSTSPQSTPTPPQRDQACEAGHQHHPVSRCANHRVGLSGPLQPGERYAAWRALSPMTFRWQALAQPLGKPLPSQTGPAWIGFTEVTDELRGCMKEFETKLAVLKGRVHAAGGQSRRAGGQPSSSTTHQAQRPGHLCGGGQTLQRSANAEVGPARAQVGPPPSATTCSFSLHTSFTGQDLLAARLRGRKTSAIRSSVAAGPTGGIGR